MARPHSTYSISREDRNELSAWLRASNTRRSLAQRAQILLLSNKGINAEKVADKLGCAIGTVYKWRNRYSTDGLEGLKDLPRSGQPTKLTRETINWVLKTTTERIPKEATHWSIRLMAKYAGISAWQVQQIWKSADLKPHRLKTFKISNDPEFAEKVVDVVGLYMNPPDNAMVLSVDEKTQIQALDRTQPMLPLKPGQIERRTHDYKRHGTASLYAAFDIATGEVIGRITQRHRAKEFLDFLRQIDRQTPSHLDLHLILDNSSTHKTEQVRKWLAEHSRFKLHFTPTSASWLNAVEGWFGQLERRSLYRGVFTSVKELRDEIRRYIQVHNEEIAKPFQWTKRAEVIIEAVNRTKINAAN
ncbi:MAG: IS630 family transposase [Chloroflexi bacterium]|nr:IS630 family transposase [Chloroflexota bacterium]